MISLTSRVTKEKDEVKEKPNKKRTVKFSPAKETKEDNKEHLPMASEDSKAHDF